MNIKLEAILEEVVVAYSRYYSDICLEGITKIAKNLIQDNRSTEPNSNLAYLEFKSRALPPEQPSEIVFHIVTKFRTGFKEERPGWSPRGLHKTGTGSTHFVEIFASLKSRNVSLNF
jgi:hypothetical protein